MKHSRKYALYCAGLLLLTGISALAQSSADRRSKQYWDYGYARDYGGEFGNAGSGNQGDQGYRQQSSDQGNSNSSDYNSNYYQGDESYVPQERSRRTATKPRRKISHAAPVRMARSQTSQGSARYGQCLPGFRSSGDASGNFSCKSSVPRCPGNMAFQAVVPSDSSGAGPFEYRCFSPQR